MTSSDPYSDAGEILPEQLVDHRDLGLSLGRLQELAAEAAVLEQLRTDVRTTPEDLLGTRPDALRDVGKAATVEIQESDRVLTQHQAELILGHARKGDTEEVRGVRPRALR